MLINLSPVISSATMPHVRVAGDVLTVGAQSFDLSGVPEGATLDGIDAAVFARAATRTDGVLSVTLFLPVSNDAPEEARFPAPVTVTEGPVPLPVATADPVADPFPVAVDLSQIVQPGADAPAGTPRTSVTRRILARNARNAGLISQTEAVAWTAGNALPAIVAAWFSRLDHTKRDDVELEILGATEIERNNPNIAAIGQYLSLSDEQIDVLFLAE